MHEIVVMIRIKSQNKRADRGKRLWVMTSKLTSVVRCWQVLLSTAVASVSLIHVPKLYGG